MQKVAEEVGMNVGSCITILTDDKLDRHHVATNLGAQLLTFNQVENSQESLERAIRERKIHDKHHKTFFK